MQIVLVAKMIDGRVCYLTTETTWSNDVTKARIFSNTNDANKALHYGLSISHPAIVFGKQEKHPWFVVFQQVSGK
jgi:hypothetical protein